MLKAPIFGLIGGAIWSSGGIHLPAETLPLFAVIFATYGSMMVWELRVLVTERPRTAGSRNSRRVRTFQPEPMAPRPVAARLTHTRSSTA